MAQKAPEDGDTFVPPPRRVRLAPITGAGCGTIVGMFFLMLASAFPVDYEGSLLLLFGLMMSIFAGGGFLLGLALYLLGISCDWSSPHSSGNRKPGIGDRDCK